MERRNLNNDCKKGRKDGKEKSKQRLGGKEEKEKVHTT